MRGLDVLTTRQVCDRARQLHAARAVISARREIELRHRRPHQSLTLVLQPAKPPYLPDAHIRVGDDIGRLGIGKSVALNVARGLD